MLRKNIPYVLMGAGAGWLVGLSLSPVIASVLGALLVVVTGVVAAAVGLKKPEEGEARADVRPWPVALLMLSMAVFATAAIPVREGDYLVPSRSRNVPVDSSGARARTAAHRGGLYAGPSPDACASVARAEGPELIDAFRTAPDSVFNLLGERVKDASTLAAVRTAICGTKR